MRTVTWAGQRDLPDLGWSDLQSFSDDIVRSHQDETDRLGVEEFATHQLSLDKALEAQAPLCNGGVGNSEVST